MRKLRIMLTASLLGACSSGVTIDEQNDTALNDDAREWGTDEEALVGNAADFGETANTGPISTFCNSGNTRIRSMLVSGSRVYIGGKFCFTSGANTYKNIAAFDIPASPTAAMTLVSGFHPQINDTVWAIAADASKVYIGGEFTTIDAASPNRAGLAALTLAGALDASFIADLGSGYVIDRSCPTADAACGSSPPNNADKGVHALALNGSTLIVGGNFATIKGVSRSGLAAVDTTNGNVSTSKFTSGVPNGFVSSIQWVSGTSTAYVGGYFTVGAHVHLLATDASGVVKANSFSPSQRVFDLDYDTTNSRLYAAVGGSGNMVRAFNTSGTTAWSSPIVHGDVQTVHYYNGGVYFGFHDGMFADGASGNTGDQYKLAAVKASNGAFLVDKANPNGTCNSANASQCWAPTADPANGATGFWGLWTIEHYTSANGTRLLVGGDVVKWGNVNSKFFASFGP